MTRRLVVCGDAMSVLPRSLASARRRVAVVTSLPDASETGWSMPDWRDWFEAAVLDVAGAAAVEGAVFYQTDRRTDGHLESKAGPILGCGVPIRWHKIVLRRAVGGIDLHRPGYAHMIAVGGPRPGPATPDVIPPSHSVYSNGMPVAAVRVALNWVRPWAMTVLDPFCGRGTVLAMANALGMDAVGVDIDPEQCAMARDLDLPFEML